MTQRTIRLTASLLVLAALATGAATAGADRSTDPEPPKLADLAWLVGGWEASMGGATVEEHWIHPAGGTMMGVNRTVAGPRTVAFEFLRIEERKDGIYYIAHPNASAGTAFKLTESTPKRAVFENPEHDFPKVITYEKSAGGALVAEISGKKGAPGQKFAFKPRKR